MTTTNLETAEKARMSAIMDLPEGASNPRLAGHLAVSTTMTPEAARKTLDAASGKGTFAHLDTPEAKAGITAWQERRAAEQAQTTTAQQTARAVHAARAVGVAPRTKR